MSITPSIPNKWRKTHMGIVCFIIVGGHTNA